MAAEWEAAVSSALAGLSEPHREKKKATIIALVDARLAGRSEETIWKRPEVCNRRTYHMRWKQEPDFAEALETVTKLAIDWKDTRSVRALQDAAERLALASPVAVGKVISLLASQDESILLRAAFGILDRAGLETATKGTVDVQESGADDARAKLAKLLAGRAGPGTDQRSAEGADGS